jgi:hypothetical protein
VIGMVCFLRDSSLTTDSVITQGSFMTILLPYAALAFAILSVLILMLIAKCYTGVRMRLMNRTLRKHLYEGTDRRLKNDRQRESHAKSLQV